MGPDLRIHIVPFFAGKELARITPIDIERYVAVKQRTLASKTVRNRLGTIHSVFALGLRRGWCRTNPIKLADRPVIRRTDTRIRFLDPGQPEALLAAPYPDDAFGRVEPALYLTAAMTGLRQGELLGLRDVDFAARKLRVVSPYVRGEFSDPKSEGSAAPFPSPTALPWGYRSSAKALSTPATVTSSSAIRRPAARSIARSSSAASSKC